MAYDPEVFAAVKAAVLAGAHLLEAELTRASEDHQMLDPTIPSLLNAVAGSAMVLNDMGAADAAPTA